VGQARRPYVRPLALYGRPYFSLLASEFTPWSTVHHYFRLWRLNGTWERINAVSRESIRMRRGREPQPSAGILDTQSVKTISVGGIRGYDGAKKLSGRKRHLLVDTLGMVLKARAHSSNLQDRCSGSSGA
jgi:putative transposase